MNKEKRRVPKLRFPGFTEDWEQRKLGNLATVEMNKRIFKEQTTTKGDIPFYKIGTFGSDADSFISRELFEEYKNKYPYPNIGDILISASGSIGRTVVYNGEDAYYQDSNIVWLNHNGQIDNSFLLQFYNQVKWAGLEGSTIKRLYNKNILETNIALPKIEEQRLIGKFFKLVDSSITLHQRKLEHLNLKKKALLQKLFPKYGERYPELRFPGFTDAWEQRKLSDITEIVMGQSPSSKNYTDNPNDNILVQGNADLKDGKVVPRLWTKEITKTIDKDGIILTVRAPVGDVAKTDYKVVLGRGVAGIKGNDYIYQFLQKLQNNRYWVSLSSGSTFESINSNDIKDLIIDIPSIEEQTKISMLLNNVNSIITLHQRKLEHLQLQKKALLQQMFV